jgi:glucokinase
VKLGIDIGGTKTAAVAINQAGTIVASVRIPTGFGAAAVVATATEAVTELAIQTGTPITGFESIGIGIPGAVDSETGIVSHAVNLGFEELDLAAALAERLGVAVRVENDVKAAALGAFRTLFGEPSEQNVDKPMAYLNLGTGLAAGLVLNGRLWRGSRGTAGEIGHIPVDPDGVLCLCGQRGCLETMASGSAIARQWPSNDPIPVLSLLTAADGGDQVARVIRDQLVDSVAAAVRVLVLTVDVEVVVIGGGLSSLGDKLLDRVQATLRLWAAESPFLASLHLDQRVQLVPPGVPVAALGAALVGHSPSLIHEG